MLPAPGAEVVCLCAVCCACCVLAFGASQFRCQCRFCWAGFVDLFALNTINNTFYARHPDKNDDPVATERFQQVSAAYAKLTSPEVCWSVVCYAKQQHSICPYLFRPTSYF